MRRVLVSILVAAVFVGGYLVGVMQPALPTLAQNTDEQCFQETGKCIRGAFLRYWRENGGLRQQGFPITDEMQERNAPPPAGDGEMHTVQYFQRARFELHPEFAGTENEVLLGLLGAEQVTAKYGPPLPPGVGSRGNSIPLRTALRLPDGWQLRVDQANLNANMAIEAAKGQYSTYRLPKAGHQYVLITISATRTAEPPDEFISGARLSLVGNAGIEREYGCNLNDIPNSFPYREVFPGSTLTGNMCWEIPSSDIDALVLYDDSQRAENRSYLALR